MSTYPCTSDELKGAGYVFSNHAKCAACGTAIEWYTTPHGRMLPLLEMKRGSDPVTPHWSHACAGTVSLFRGLMQ